MDKLTPLICYINSKTQRIGYLFLQNYKRAVLFDCGPRPWTIDKFTSEEGHS